MKVKRLSMDSSLFSIRGKLIGIIVLLVVLSITSVKVYDYNVRVSEIDKSIKEESLNTAILTASQLETEIGKTVATLETAANNGVFASDDQGLLVKTLLSIKEQNQIFSTVFLCDADLNRLNEKGEITSLLSLLPSNR